MRLLVLAALLLGGTVAHACSCQSRSDVQNFQAASAVVVGVVLETKYVQDKSIFGGGYIKAKVRANDVIKGKVARVFTVIDELPEGGMCTSFLRAGVEFVLFVDDRHEVGMCSGTRPLGATIHDRSEKLREVRRLSAGKS